MESKEILGVSLSQGVVGILVVVGYLVAVLLLRRALFRRISTWAAQSETRWDDVVLHALRFPVILLIFISTALLVGRIVQLPVVWSQALDLIVRVGTIVALVMFADRFLCGAVELYQKQLDSMHLSRSFSRVIVRVAVLIVGSMIILDTMNISITPMLASLGVGGLAVGLALQGTLSNLFAGMQVISDRPIRVGDFIRLESGEHGYVTEIGWRATKIRMLPNNTVIIPNSKIAESIITNYYQPAQDLSVLVQVGVHYDSDLEHVERITCEVGKEIQQTVPGGLADFDPFIRYHTFDGSSINFTVILRAREFVDHYLMKHEFIKRLHARYTKEGIVIPFPIRTLDVPPGVLDRLGKPDETKPSKAK